MIGGQSKSIICRFRRCESSWIQGPIHAINQHCKGVTVKHRIIDRVGREQEMRVIREPDVYRLVTNSKLPAAQDFENWVMEDVLPSIRHTGAYEVPKGIPFAELFTATAQLLENQGKTEAAITELTEKVDLRMTLDYGQQLAIERAKKSGQRIFGKNSMRNHPICMTRKRNCTDVLGATSNVPSQSHLIVISGRTNSTKHSHMSYIGVQRSFEIVRLAITRLNRHVGRIQLDDCGRSRRITPPKLMDQKPRWLQRQAAAM